MCLVKVCSYETVHFFTTCALCNDVCFFWNINLANKVNIQYMYIDSYYSLQTFVLHDVPDLQSPLFEEQSPPAFSSDEVKFNKYSWRLSPIKVLQIKLFYIVFAFICIFLYLHINVYAFAIKFYIVIKEVL